MVPDTLILKRQKGRALQKILIHLLRGGGGDACNMSRRYSCSQPLINLMDSYSQFSRDVELKTPRFAASVGVFINASLITPWL